jgi:hypothetical protein
MVSTRSGGNRASASVQAGEKRGPDSKKGGPTKKAKTVDKQDGKLEVGSDGQVGLKAEDEESKVKTAGDEGTQQVKDEDAAGRVKNGSKKEQSESKEANVRCLPQCGPVRWLAESTGSSLPAPDTERRRLGAKAWYV